MGARKAKRASKKAKDLPQKRLTLKQAKDVRGGGAAGMTKEFYDWQPPRKT